LQDVVSYNNITIEENYMESINVGEHSDVKKIRLSEWQGMVEQEIQTLMMDAARLRKIMNESKTSTKREYYDKKFKKVSNEALKLVNILQVINAKQSTQEVKENDDQPAAS